MEEKWREKGKKLRGGGEVWRKSPFIKMKRNNPRVSTERGSRELDRTIIPGQTS